MRLPTITIVNNRIVQQPLRVRNRNKLPIKEETCANSTVGKIFIAFIVLLPQSLLQIVYFSETIVVCKLLLLNIGKTQAMTLNEL